MLRVDEGGKPFICSPEALIPFGVCFPSLYSFILFSVLGVRHYRSDGHVDCGSLPPSPPPLLLLDGSLILRPSTYRTTLFSLGLLVVNGVGAIVTLTKGGEFAGLLRS